MYFALFGIKVLLVAGKNQWYKVTDHLSTTTSNQTPLIPINCHFSMFINHHTTAVLVRIMHLGLVCKVTYNRLNGHMSCQCPYMHESGLSTWKKSSAYVTVITTFSLSLMTKKCAQQKSKGSVKDLPLWPHFETGPHLMKFIHNLKRISIHHILPLCQLQRIYSPHTLSSCPYIHPLFSHLKNWK